MGVSTGYLMLAKSKKSGFSNADGTSTPNLDYLTTQLNKQSAIIDKYTVSIKKLDDYIASLSSMLKDKNLQATECKGLAATFSKCKNLFAEISDIVNKIDTYKNRKVSYQAIVDKAKAKYNELNSQISQYQSAVNQGLASGKTEQEAMQAGETLIREMNKGGNKNVWLVAGIGGIVLIGSIVLIARRK